MRDNQAANNENGVGSRRESQDKNLKNQKEKQGYRTLDKGFEDEDQGAQNMETFRSIDDGGEPMTSERQSSVQNDSEREQKTLRDDSFEDDVSGNILKSNELKDDKAIVKSAAQNDRYNLVERPRFLISFELKDQE